MAKEKKTKFVILGFLLHEPMSGYEIGEMIEQSTGNFWHESDASIYPTLKVLAKEKLVTSKIEYVGKRKKEVFTITAKGKKAFFEWFKRTPDRDLHREEFLLKLFFTDDTTEQQMQEHAKERLKELKNLRKTYKEIETFLEQEMPHKKYWLKTLRIGLAHLELDLSLHGEKYVRNHG